MYLGKKALTYTLIKVHKVSEASNVSGGDLLSGRGRHTPINALPRHVTSL
jgi:hypothetical protein